jgi:hypothetical protein
MAMSEEKPFKINITVPLGYHKPFADVVHDVRAKGLNVQAAYPESQAIQGLGSPAILQELKAIPGIFVSQDDHELTWRV